MAEDEIRKHTKAVFSIAKDTKMNWKHKTTEILIEVAIIIFAVSVSIWLHNLSDRNKERKEEKEFLIGLKEDLQTDIEHLKSSESFYQNELRGMQYFISIAGSKGISTDSLEKYQNIFFSSTYLDPNISRYTGLKGAGKFGIIENHELLNYIINIHEVHLPRIDVLNNIFNDYNSSKTNPFLHEHLQLDSSNRVVNAVAILQTSQMRLYILYLGGLIQNNILTAHQKAIEECDSLIKKIDQELK